MQQLEFLEAGIQDRQQRIVHRDVDPCQLAVGTNDRRLFREKFIPAKTDVLKPPLQWNPGALLPAQAVFDGVAILHQRLLDLFAHFMRMRSAKRRHLAIPPRSEILAKALEPEELAQCVKVLGKSRARVVHFRLLQELAPRLVREQGQGAELAAVLKVYEDFAGNAFLLFDSRTFGSLRAVLDE